MSKIKTISGLPAFTGDTSMRLHVHKPGKSEGLSLNEIAGLVTTGEGLQTGDVVLRPNGFYADALECNGAVYETSVAPVLADMISFGGNAVMPMSINFNSELRFGSTQYQYVKKAGNTVLAQTSNMASVFINEVNTFNRAISNNGLNTGYAFSVADRIYYMTRLSTQTSADVYRADGNGLTFLNRWSVNTKMLGAVNYDASTDDIFVSSRYAEGSLSAFTLIMVRADIVGDYRIAQHFTYSGLLVTHETVVFERSGAHYAIGTVNGVSGYHQLDLSGVGASTTISEFTVSRQPEYRSGNTILVMQSDTTIAHFNLDTLEISPFNYGIASTSIVKSPFIIDDLLVCISYSNRPAQISFDGGTTWSDGPTLSAYSEMDYEGGDFVFSGGTGSTGSINNQSGTIQKNEANFPSDTLFSVPKIRSSHTNMAYYITK